MNTTSNALSDKAAYNPFLFKAYKIIKKIAKYTLYMALVYFAIEGFVAWK